MSVIYYYWYYHGLEHEEMDSLIEALERAKNDIEYNMAHPEKIVLEDGTVLSQEEVVGRSGFFGDTGPIIDGSVVVETLALPSGKEQAE